MQRLIFASLVAVLLALPGCELLESSPSATVTVQQEGTAPACCPMEGAGTAGDAAAATMGDCGECPSASAKTECDKSGQCDASMECEEISECKTDCEIQCEESPCEIDGDTKQ